MGAHPYWYVVPHEDLQDALDKLRAREFKAGRYNPVLPFLEFPNTDRSPAPGSRHRTIEQALQASDADGTRSILDISRIATAPGFGRASPLSAQRLLELYGTTRPSQAAVEANMDFFEELERGHAIYIELYEQDTPVGILFAGYSYD